MIFATEGSECYTLTASLAFSFWWHKGPDSYILGAFYLSLPGHERF